MLLKTPSHQVDYVDIPLKAMSNAEVKTKVITFKFRAKKLSGEAQKLAGRDQELLFAIAAKEDSLARFWKEVSRHVVCHAHFPHDHTPSSTEGITVENWHKAWP